MSPQRGRGNVWDNRRGSSQGRGGWGNSSRFGASSWSGYGFGSGRGGYGGGYGGGRGDGPKPLWGRGW